MNRLCKHAHNDKLVTGLPKLVADFILFSQKIQENIHAS